MLLARCCGLIALLVAGSSLAKDVIYSEFPVASVVAGRAQDGSPVYEQIVAAVTLPEVKPPLPGAFPNCLHQAMRQWGVLQAGDLDVTPSGFQQDTYPRIDTSVIDVIEKESAQTVTLAHITAVKDERAAQVGQWVNDQRARILAKVAHNCGGVIPESHRNQIRLLLSLRRCPVPLPLSATHPCRLAYHSGTNSAAALLRPRAYTQLYAWVQSNGERPADQWIEPVAGSKVRPTALATPPQSLSPAEWPNIPFATRLQQFEAQVNYLHSLGC
jgi:hypothetical protein